ncbi:MAG: SET domain-containing protein-lysine N-methyltransferase [Phenylobacterium sp.]
MNRAPTALTIRRDAIGEALYAAHPYLSGDIVLDFAEVEWRPQRDRHTVQHPSGCHLFHPVLATVSHSCDPNCRIQPQGRILVALRPIAAGEPITFDYLTTESRFARPFQCQCGAPNCRRRIG